MKKDTMRGIALLVALWSIVGCSPAEAARGGSKGGGTCKSWKCEPPPPPPPPPPPTYAATISWLPPLQNEDGSALTDLAGYRLYYNGSLLTDLGAGLATYVVDGLSTGTHCFYMTALNSKGVESVPSETVCKTY